MKNSRILTVVSIFLTAALGMAQRPAPAPEHPAQSHARTAAPKTVSTAHLSDVQIEAAIRNKLAKSKIGVEKFTFRAQGGVVTIEGKTDVIQRKGAATRIARTSGAVAVNNHIEISAAGKEKATANLEKGRRRVQVKRGDPRSGGGS